MVNGQRETVWLHDNLLVKITCEQKETTTAEWNEIESCGARRVSENFFAASFGCQLL